MARKSRTLVLRVRYKGANGDLGTRFRISNQHRSLKAGKSSDRVLSIRKVSKEELFKLGEFNSLPVALMRELGTQVVSVVGTTGRTRNGQCIKPFS